MSEKAAPEPPAPAVIDATFRNGSLTVIGVLTAFSLGFLTRWGGAPGTWSASDYAAVAAIALGIALEVVALACLLSTRSLVLAYYNRVVRVFVVGLAFLVVGVLVALGADIVGLGQRILRD